jgi:hypothetical protein
MMPTHPVDWSQANCIGTDNEAFYPEVGESVRAPKKIINECFTYAIHHERHGIWGGSSANERIQIRRKNNIILTGAG